MNESRRLRLLLVFALIVVSLGGYGLYWWVWLRGTVATDDAYVDARIVSISSRLPGRIAEVYVNEGELVERGQPVAALGPKKLMALVATRRAEVEAAESYVKNLIRGPSREAIEVTEAEVAVREVDLAKSLQNFSRAKRLAAAEAISVAEHEDRRSDVALARARLKVSRMRLADLTSGTRQEEIDQARAAVARAKAMLADAEVDLHDQQMRSPVDGIVAKRTVDPGEVVEPGQGMFQIVENARTWVVANLEEQDIAELVEGQTVEIKLDAYPGQTFLGKVGPLYGATLSRFSLLSTSSASGNFIKVTQRVPVRIDWAEPHGVVMVPGLNAEVRIRLNGSEPSDR